MADTDSLDTTLFDAIILGTGFTQTVIAAALARAGKTVLHLDENDYYGGESGAFAFRDLASWAHNVASTKGEATVLTDGKLLLRTPGEFVSLSTPHDPQYRT